MSLWWLATTEALFEIVTIQNLSTDPSPLRHQMCIWLYKLTPIYRIREPTEAIKALLLCISNELKAEQHSRLNLWTLDISQTPYETKNHWWFECQTANEAMLNSWRWDIAVKRIYPIYISWHLNISQSNTSVQQHCRHLFWIKAEMPGCNSSKALHSGWAAVIELCVNWLLAPSLAFFSRPDSNLGWHGYEKSLRMSVGVRAPDTLERGVTFAR